MAYAMIAARIHRGKTESLSKKKSSRPAAIIESPVKMSGMMNAAKKGSAVVSVRITTRPMNAIRWRQPTARTNTSRTPETSAACAAAAAHTEPSR